MYAESNKVFSIYIDDCAQKVYYNVSNIRERKVLFEEEQVMDDNEAFNSILKETIKKYKVAIICVQDDSKYS